MCQGGEPKKSKNFIEKIKLSNLFRNRQRFQRQAEAWNSDDEERAQADSYIELMSRQTDLASTIFEDTSTEYCDFGTLIRRIIDWFQTNPRSFRDAYVAECIPKLVGPFVRIQLFEWNPLHINCPKLSSFDWYRSILALGFNNEGIDVDDPAISGLIPDIVEKIVVPKLTSKFSDTLIFIIFAFFRNCQRAMGSSFIGANTASN